MPTADMLEQHQWLVLDPSTLQAGRLVQGTRVYAPMSSLEKAIAMQMKYPFSVILEIRFRAVDTNLLILFQGVVVPE